MPQHQRGGQEAQSHKVTATLRDHGQNWSDVAIRLKT